MSSTVFDELSPNSHSFRTRTTQTLLGNEWELCEQGRSRQLLKDEMYMPVHPSREWVQSTVTFVQHEGYRMYIEGKRKRFVLSAKINPANDASDTDYGGSKMDSYPGPGPDTHAEYYISTYEDFPSWDFIPQNSYIGIVQQQPDSSFLIGLTNCHLCDHRLGKFTCGRSAVQREVVGRLSQSIRRFPNANLDYRYLHVSIPTVAKTGTRKVWCPRAFRKVNASVPNSADVNEALPLCPEMSTKVVSKLPEWNETSKNLMVKFRGGGRVLIASSRNFLLVEERHARGDVLSTVDGSSPKSISSQTSRTAIGTTSPHPTAPSTVSKIEKLSISELVDEINSSTEKQRSANNLFRVGTCSPKNAAMDSGNESGASFFMQSPLRIFSRSTRQLMSSQNDISQLDSDQSFDIESPQVSRTGRSHGMDPYRRVRRSSNMKESLSPGPTAAHAGLQQPRNVSVPRLQLGSVLASNESVRKPTFKIMDKDKEKELNKVLLADNSTMPRSARRRGKHQRGSQQHVDSDGSNSATPPKITPRSSRSNRSNRSECVTPRSARGKRSNRTPSKSSGSARKRNDESFLQRINRELRQDAAHGTPTRSPASSRRQYDDSPAVAKPRNYVEKMVKLGKIGTPMRSPARVDRAYASDGEKNASQVVQEEFVQYIERAHALMEENRRRVRKDESEYLQQQQSHPSQKMKLQSPADNDCTFSEEKNSDRSKRYSGAKRDIASRAILQFGKASPTQYILDFRYPLSPLQAFGLALAAIAAQDLGRYNPTRSRYEISPKPKIGRRNPHSHHRRSKRTLANTPPHSSGSFRSLFGLTSGESTFSPWRKTTALTESSHSGTSDDDESFSSFDHLNIGSSFRYYCPDELISP